MLYAGWLERPADSESCGDDIEDPACVNTICLNNECGRQVGLIGCSTSIATPPWVPSKPRNQ